MIEASKILDLFNEIYFFPLGQEYTYNTLFFIITLMYNITAHYYLTMS